MPNDPHFEPDGPRLDLNDPRFDMPRIDLRRQGVGSNGRVEPRMDTLLPGVDPEPELGGYRYPRRASADSGTRRLALIAGGLAVVLVAFIGIWSVGHRHGGAIPVIEADRHPLRVKPANPGGMQLAGADDPFMSGAGGDEKDALAPPPEVPEPAKLRQAALQMAATATAARVVTAPALPEPAAPAPRSAAPVHAAAEGPTERHVAEHRAAGRLVAEREEHAGPARDSQEHDARNSAASDRGDEERAAPGRGDRFASARPAREAATEREGNAAVQLAAVSSEDAARHEWERLSHRMPDLLGSRHPELSRTERDGHVFWRLRTGGFPDAAQAAVFCAQVRAKGGGCSVASF